MWYGGTEAVTHTTASTAYRFPLPTWVSLRRTTCPPCRQLQAATAVHHHAAGDPDLRRGLASYLRELQVGLAGSG